MKLFFRFFILAFAVLAAFALSRVIWTLTSSGPAELRIHVLFLTFGYVLMIGAGLQEAVHVIGARTGGELKSITIFRLVATVAATIGFVFGELWAARYGKISALQKPVMMTDLIVLALAWFVSFKPFQNRPTAYWDIVVGIAALTSWYVAKLH